MKIYDLNQKKILMIITTILIARQAYAIEDSMYQCLDAIELAERFEIHANRATYMMDQFKTTTFEGKTMTWDEIEGELTKAGYTDGVTHANPGPEQKNEMDVKKANALKNPRIARLAGKYEREYRSKASFERNLREQDTLLSKTFTFHENRGGAHLITGVQRVDTREDGLSPVRPYGLLATRAKADGQYLYLLTKEGVRRVKASDKAATGNNRYFIALKRLADGDSPRGEFPKIDVIKLNGTNVTSNWPSDTESKAAGVEPFAVLDEPAKVASKFGTKLTIIDTSKLPLNEEISADSKAVFKEELLNIMGKIVSSHDNQMAYLTKLTPAQKERIQKDWNFDERKLSEVYTERYATALQKCADLNIGLTDDALGTIAKISANQRKRFPSEQPGGKQAEPSLGVQ